MCRLRVGANPPPGLPSVPALPRPTNRYRQGCTSRRYIGVPAGQVDIMFAARAASPLLGLRPCIRRDWLRQSAITWMGARPGRRPILETFGAPPPGLLSTWECRPTQQLLCYAESTYFTVCRPCGIGHGRPGQTALPTANGSWHSRRPAPCSPLRILEHLDPGANSRDGSGPPPSRTQSLGSNSKRLYKFLG